MRERPREAEVRSKGFCSPTEKEGQALIFQSRRQIEESSSEVCSLTCYVRSHEIGRNDVGVSSMDISQSFQLLIMLYAEQ